MNTKTKEIISEITDMKGPVDSHSIASQEFLYKIIERSQNFDARFLSDSNRRNELSEAMAGWSSDIPALPTFPKNKPVLLMSSRTIVHTKDRPWAVWAGEWSTPTVLSSIST